MGALSWIALTGAVVLAAFSAMPWLRSGWWVVRICDFPRAQLGAVGLLGVFVSVGLLLGGQDNWVTVAAIALYTLTAVVQAAHVAPFLPLWPNSVADAPGGERVRLLVSNLDYENNRPAEAAKWLERDDLDVFGAGGG